MIQMLKFALPYMAFASMDNSQGESDEAVRCVKAGLAPSAKASTPDATTEKFHSTYSQDELLHAQWKDPQSI